MSLTIPKKDRATLLRELGAVKKISAQAMLSEASRTLSRYLIQATPPFNRHPFGQNVWAQQKRLGIASIKRDFAKAFQPFTPDAVNKYTHNISKHAAASLREYARAGLLGKLNALLKKLGFPSNMVVIRFVTPELARQNVSFMSRPHRIKQRYLVINRASIKRELDNAIEHVGRAKAGWLPAASKVGYQGAPEWVKRHGAASSGSVIDQRNDARSPTITMINSTQGAEAHDEDVVWASLQQLELSLASQMRSIMAKEARKFNHR